MNTICDIPVELTPFQLFGLCLQEPMTLLTDLIIAITTFVLLTKIPKNNLPFTQNWRKFYLYFGVSTLLGGFGHLFFYYLDIYGKFPTWIIAVFASFYAGKAMINIPLLNKNTQAVLLKVIYIKSIVILGLVLYFQSFLYVTIDAIFTYLFFCLGLGIFYWKKGIPSTKYFVIGVAVLVPSVFIFLFDYNPSIWFNKNDLSHVFITITVILFYFGVIHTTSELEGKKK